MIFLILPLLFLIPDDALGYRWDVEHDFRGWQFQNVRDIQFNENSAVLYGKSGSPDFMMSPPVKKISSRSRVHVKLRTMEPGGVLNCILIVRNRMLPSPYIPIMSGRSWKDYVCDLQRFDLQEDVIDGIVLLIGNIDSVEMSTLQIGMPSFSDFFVNSGLSGSSINAKPPFMLFGYSLNLWFYAFIVLSVICMLIVYMVTRNRKVFYTVVIIYLALYLLYDARENLENIEIAHTIYTDFITAQPGEKRFFYMEDLIGFARFIEWNIPDGEDTLHFLGDRDIYLYLEYLLYPKNLIYSMSISPGVNVFFSYNNMHIIGGSVMREGKRVLENGRLVAYNHRAFIYIPQ